MKPEKKREIAAEIITDVSDKNKDAFETAVHMTIRSAKETFPDLDDATLGKFCECIARIVTGFQYIPVGQLNNAMDSMFSSYMVASASFEGLIDLGAPTEAMQKIIDQAMTEEQQQQPEDTSNNLKNTGMYL